MPHGLVEIASEAPPTDLQIVYQGGYQGGLERNPKLQGRVTVRFVIGLDGQVSEVENGGSDRAIRYPAE